MEQVIDYTALQSSVKVLRALCHPLRMKILDFINKHEKVHVNKIYNTLQLEQSITSQHLRILRNAGILNTNRDGKFIYYEIDKEKITQVSAAINAFIAEENGKGSREGLD